MKIARSVFELWEAIDGLHKGGKTIALVPTMGALHDGHLSLVEIARQNADAVVASIFVNPTQFGEGEDFDKYPKDEGRDLNKLKESAVDIVYIPDINEMYPQGFCTTVSVKKNTDILCGASRPGHFDGVITVVAKLFMQCLPDVAVFGEKDYQQLHLIKRMTEDMDLPVSVVGAPIIREHDGLAMSSRNEYLNAEERKIAPEIFRMMEEMKEKSSNESVKKLCEWGKNYLLEKGFTKVDYVEIGDSETLQLVEEFPESARVFVAAHLGNTRLIDNLEIVA